MVGGGGREGCWVEEGGGVWVGWGEGEGEGTTGLLGFIWQTPMMNRIGFGNLIPSHDLLICQQKRKTPIHSICHGQKQEETGGKQYHPKREGRRQHHAKTDENTTNQEE